MTWNQTEQTHPQFEDYRASVAESYERIFVPAISAPLAVHLVELAGLSADERVLDVACGTGVVARLAAQRVGPDRVVGLDVHPGMLTVARSTSPPGMEWQEGSAESLPFPDRSFDTVFCQMGLQFVPQPETAVGEMLRVLTPGGKAVLNLPGPIPRPLGVLADALAQRITPEAAGFVERVFSLYDPEQVAGLLSGAGLVDVEVDRSTVALRLPSPVEFLWQYVHSTPLVEPVAQATPEARAALAEDIATGWETYTTEQGSLLEVEMTLVVGRRPG